jgi:hypothetical protein
MAHVSPSINSDYARNECHKEPNPTTVALPELAKPVSQSLCAKERTFTSVAVLHTQQNKHQTLGTRLTCGMRVHACQAFLAAKPNDAELN